MKDSHEPNLVEPAISLIDSYEPSHDAASGLSRTVLDAAVVDAAIPRPELCELGLFDFHRLRDVTKGRDDSMIDGLIKTRSLNVLVGDSGIGKTALAVQLGVCVASGKPFLGHGIQAQGPVLYCDAESGMRDFLKILESISRFLALDEPPSDFIIANPYWEQSSDDISQFLLRSVAVMKPSLVIVDPLRPFWPEAVEKGADTAAVVNRLRKTSQDSGCSFLLLHHMRKKDRKAARVTLDSGHEFFEEAAGARTIINSTDTRLGVEASSDAADLRMAGFARIQGWFGPLSIARELDEKGEPVGYTLLRGAAFLNGRYRDVYDQLGKEFRHGDVKRVGGFSSSSVQLFLDQTKRLGVVEPYGRAYRKVSA